MNLINVFPVGKENKKTRKELMQEANIKNIEDFKKDLSELRKNYIVAFDQGYYVPANKEEYEEIIEKLKAQVSQTNNVIDLAYKEMKELDE